MSAGSYGGREIAFAAEESAGVSPKTHTVFMGVDIAVVTEMIFRRAREVSGGSLGATSTDGRSSFPRTSRC